MPITENLGDPVPRDEPFIVPASPEETYDSIWVRSINIYAPNTAEEDPTGGSLSLEMLPYDGVAKKVLITPDNEGVEYINVPARENGRKPFAKGRVLDLITHNFGLGITHTKLAGIEIFRGVKLKEECSSDGINPDFLKQCDEVLK